MFKDGRCSKSPRWANSIPRGMNWQRSDQRPTNHKEDLPTLAAVQLHSHGASKGTPKTLTLGLVIYFIVVIINRLKKKIYFRKLTRPQGSIYSQKPTIGRHCQDDAHYRAHKYAFLSRPDEFVSRAAHFLRSLFVFSLNQTLPCCC